MAALESLAGTVGPVLKFDESTQPLAYPVWLTAHSAHYQDNQA
jgi:hypothetical protein